MKLSRLFSSAVAAVFLSHAVPAQAAPITFDVAGTFGNTFLAGSNSSASYPFPNLLNGSFSGSFVVDDAAPRATGSATFSRFDFVSVNIDIIDNTSAVIHTIDSGPNQIFVTDGSVSFRFGESFGGDATGNPEDLRLTFDSASILGGDTLFNVGAALAGTFNSGFIETDSATSGFWDLEVASATISSDSVVVSEPGAALIFGIGLAGIALRRRMAR